MPDAGSNPSTIALWNLGFRPFFLGGCIWGAVALALWLVTFLGHGWSTHIDAHWHAHEMLHGFVVAIVVGFLLTASQNWSGIRGAHGRTLKILVATWTVGRLVMVLPEVSVSVVAVADLVFLPLVAAYLVRHFLRADQRHNLIFVALLALLWSSNLFYHLDRIGLVAAVARQAIYFGVHTVIVMIVVVSSRVVPLFTENAVQGYRRKNARSLNLACVGASIVYAFVAVWYEGTATAAVVALAAGVVTLFRFGLWFDWRVLRLPILWILYAGYAWVVAGFFLSALADAGFVAPSIAVHAFTAGAIATMIIGMVSRVTLGHTGRPIVASTAAVAAYALVLVSGLARVFGPLVMPLSYSRIISWSGAAWILALLAFLAGFALKLVSPRVDGRLG